MKTSEEIVKGIRHRITRIEEYMDMLMSKWDDPDHGEIASREYWIQYALHSELCALESYITGDKIR